VIVLYDCGLDTQDSRALHHLADETIRSDIYGRM
jgi:hypothetical protein